MIRKLIAQGNGSQTITLPAKWLVANGVRDQIFLEELDSSLKISPIALMKKTKTLDAEGFTDIFLRQHINELYRDGFEEIILENVSPKLLQNLESLLDKFYIELELISQRQYQIVLAMVSKPNGNHFTSLFRKLFQIVSQSLVSLEEKDFAHVNNLCEQFRKYDNYCRRYVQTSQLPKRFAYQSIFVHLLLIQATLNRAANHKIALKEKHVQELFFNLTHGFFNQDISIVQKCGQLFLELLEKVYDTKSVTKQDLVYSEFIRLAYSLSYPLVGVNLDA